MTLLDQTTLSEQTQAILLLTAHFTKPSADDPKPLTPAEWGRFAEWLHARGHAPRDLLIGHPNALLEGWDDRKITAERVLALLDRGAAMALSVEKWLRAGLWVLTRSDTEYPQRLKQHLREQAPPILFGCGNKALLRQGGLAVAGSRKVAEADLEYSRVLGERAADAGVSILSGGAKGVDEAAMLGALQREGTAVGVMADSLLRASISAKYRPYLTQNALVLVSPFYPEAGFNVGNAMQRNKYIYCLADAGIAVHAGTSGGTWTGATEVLKKGWIPLWARPNDDPNTGNQVLLRMGAHPAPVQASDIDLPALLAPSSSERASREAPSSSPVSDHPPQQASDSRSDIAEIDFFQLFVAKAQPLCATAPRTPEELAEALALSKTQVNQWVKQAVAEKKLSKFSRPVRYGAPNAAQGALRLE
jgi:predicted Rossmann fold nucleotide-binding protein DprA/Smf involved in DNA uptake